MKKLILLIALALPALLTAQQRDWANYGRYAEANAQLTTPPAVVFMGNSITDGWDNAHPEFFTANNFACRGIGGQVTGQMLCRFRADVINLHPQAVVILAGTNDLAQNNGPIATQHIVENIISMAELAMAAGIRPIICSVLPAGKYPWRTEIESVPEKIRDLNARLHRYASDRDGRRRRLDAQRVHQRRRASHARRIRRHGADRSARAGALLSRGRKVNPRFRQTEKSPSRGDFFIPEVVFHE